MRTAGRILATCLVLAPAIGLGAAALAQNPSESDIANGLTRGLPTLGTTPATKGPTPGTVRASTGAGPLGRPGHRATGHGASAAPAAVERPAVSLPSITFEFNSADLRPESLGTLQNLGNALNRELKDQKKFLIEGHTDSVGTPQYNMELSQRRAEAVKDYLVQKLGVAPERLQAVGRGATEPVDPQHPNGAENRRVVIINLGAS
jgi:OmpA-OmpF porin, OOP family